MMANSGTVQLQRVELDLMVSHTICALNQIHACASGRGHLEGSMWVRRSHMPHRESLSQIDNLVPFVMSTMRSCSVLANLTP